MKTLDIRSVVLMGLIVYIQADSIILRNDCMFENGECDIILETLTGSPERDCSILSTNQRTCSRNDTIKHRRMGPAKITIYDKNGAVILKWDKNEEDSEPQRKTGYVSHVVPKSEWNRPPIFWRRRKRQRGTANKDMEIREPFETSSFIVICFTPLYCHEH
ncbi:unnamed protein product [Cylicocyclus nassatus]|uniref:Uncharacterized protein n=1 Tax=Cylicocyclus nassatus TaxID=53992 RepID=A0AA36GL17_CYLNA|nr:unnamed protein product [Cylicocyclus nassatus]